MLGNVIVYRPPFVICRVRIGRQVSPGVVKCRQVAPAPGVASWRQVMNVPSVNVYRECDCGVPLRL